MSEIFVHKRTMRFLQFSFLIIMLIFSISPISVTEPNAVQVGDNNLMQTEIKGDLPDLEVSAETTERSPVINEPVIDQVKPEKPDQVQRVQENEVEEPALTGTLRVQSLGNGQGIETDVEIWSVAETENTPISRVAFGTTNSEGIFKTNLAPGRYIAKVQGAVTQTSEVLTVKLDQTVDFVAEFISLELVPYSIGEPSPSVVLEITGDADMEIELTPAQNEVLWVTPGTYFLEGLRQSQEVKLNGYEIIPIDITLDAVAFGQLEITANSSDGIPVGANYAVYNATSGAQVATGGLGGDGFVSMNLAPGTYNVETYASDGTNRIVNSSVTIVGEQTTTVRNTFSQYIVYSNVTTWINVRDELNQNVGSSYRGSSDINVVFYLPAGIAYDFILVTPGITYYNQTSSVGEKVIIGRVIADAPYFINPPTIGARVNPNQSALVTARVFDRNYDFPLVLDRVVNFGSTIIVSGNWVATNVFEFQMNYTAPTFWETYRLDLAVVDTTNLFSNFTLYLSNRQSTVNLNSTGFNGRPITQWISAYEKYTGSMVVSAYTGSTGVTSMNLNDGEYYFVWTSDIDYVSSPYYINATYTPYSFQYNWAEVSINMTGMYGEPIGGTAKVYNAGSLSNPAVTRSVSSSTGSVLVILPAGNYSLKTYATTESSSIWHYDISLNATERPSIVSSFGVLAVYQFDAASNPEAVWIYLYNATNSLSSSIAAVYSGSSGIATFTLAPYSNYAVKSSRSATEWYYNQTILEGSVTVIGNFTNSAPVISGITASPRRIGPNENTTVTVTASDIDPIDKLTYLWTVTEGTISGSGNQVTYFAPSTVGVYKIEVNVTDNFGGWSNTTIWVSSNAGVLNVTVKLGGANYARWVTLYDKLTGSSVTSAYTGSMGYVTFSTIYPGPYEVRVTGTNTWKQEIFVNGGGTDNMDFRFASIRFNTTSSGGGIASSIKVFLNSTGAQESVVSTSSSTGLVSVALRPDIYDFEASSDGTVLRKSGISIAMDQISTFDFKFGRISIAISSVAGKPIEIWSYLYQNLGGSLSTVYSSLGSASFDVAPGIYNLSLSTTPSDWVYDIVVDPLGDTQITYQLGVLAVYTNNGTTPLSQSVAVYSGGSWVFSQNSGSNGLVVRHLAPGTYDVLIDGTTWINNVVITGGQRTEVGVRLNHAPVIVSVDSTDIGPSTTQTVTVTVSDIDYDYQYLYLDVTANVGTVSAVGAFAGFLSTGEFQITFDYTSPSTTEVYYVNITLYDTFGGSDRTVVYLSNNINPVHLYSFIDNFAPRNTPVKIYDSITGTQVYSFNLGSDGYIQANVVDGIYDIRFQEDNSIWLYNVEIGYGGYYNFSAYFGVVDIYVTTTGGNPVAAWTYAYDYPRSGSSIAAKYSGSSGIASYVLAPGTYEFDIVQTNTITIVQTVEGGVKSVIGNDVPVLTNPPADFSYTYGDVGNFIAWNFTDATPDYYNVTMDGATIQHGPWDGSVIQINVDGLFPGTYMFIIYVNDTNGLPSQDTVFVTVLPTSAPLINPHGDGAMEARSGEISWVVNGDNPDTYVVYLNGVVLETGSWSAGFINITLSGLAVGTYNLTLMINDTLGQSSIDYFVLTVVDTTPPTAFYSGNLTYVAGETGNVVTFTPFDSNAEGSYTVLIDGIADSSLPWSNGTTYQINVDGLSVGVHWIDILILDASGNQVNVTMVVTVLDPSIDLVSGPSDGSVFNAPANVSLTWQFSAVELSNFTVYMNGTVVASGAMSGDTVSYAFYQLPPGIYNITVVVRSSYGTSLSETVLFVVIYPPIFLSIPSALTYVNTTTGNTLTWEVVNATRYQVTIDGLLVADEVLTSNIIEVNVDGLSVGIHNVSVFIFGPYGYVSLRSSVFVTVIESGIILLNGPVDMTVEAPANVDLDWMIDGQLPVNYTVYVNGTEVVSGISTQQGLVSFTFSNAEIGQYNVTVIFRDNYGSILIDTVILTVADTTAPIFTNIPSDIEYVEGTLGHLLMWEFQDPYLDTFEVWIDGIMVASGSISNTSLVVNVDGLDVGIHDVTLILRDESGNTSFDTVTVTVTEIHFLEILVSPGSMLLGSGVNETTLKWKVDSSHPDVYTIAVNGVVEASNTFVDTIDFNFIHSGPGLYEIVLTVSDLNGTQVSDTVYILVVQGTESTSSQSASLNVTFMVLSLIALAIPVLRRKEVKS